MRVSVMKHPLHLFPSHLPSVDSWGRKWSFAPARVNTPRCGPLGSVCFPSSVYECSSSDPHATSLLTPPPMIFHSWPLSSILHGKIPQCWSKKGGLPIRNVAGHPSVQAMPPVHPPPPPSKISVQLLTPTYVTKPLVAVKLMAAKSFF